MRTKSYIIKEITGIDKITIIIQAIPSIANKKWRININKTRNINISKMLITIMLKTYLFSNAIFVYIKRYVVIIINSIIVINNLLYSGNLSIF